MPGPLMQDVPETANQLRLARSQMKQEQKTRTRRQKGKFHEFRQRTLGKR